MKKPFVSLEQLQEIVKDYHPGQRPGPVQSLFVESGV